MDAYMKVNAQTTGKDKIFRLLQYLSRLLWHRFQQKGNVDELKKFEYFLSTCRKLLRFGKCIEVMYSALPFINHPDVTIRFTLSLSKISNSLFLLCDHVLWLSRMGLCEVSTEKWTTLSNKYWLYSITMNLIRDFYEILKIVSDQPNRSRPTLKEAGRSVGWTVRNLQMHRDVLIDTIKNGCDFFIPLTSLGYTRLSPGATGALGVVSSIAGLLTILDKSCKLNPI